MSGNLNFPFFPKIHKDNDCITCNSPKTITSTIEVRDFCVWFLEIEKPKVSTQSASNRNVYL